MGWPAVLVAIRLLSVPGLLVPQVSLAQQMMTGKKRGGSISVRPCADWPGDDVLLWSIFGMTSSYFADTRRRGGARNSDALTGWVDLQILGDGQAHEDMKLSPLPGKESGYTWIALRPAGGVASLPLLVPTPLAEEMRGTEPVWADVVFNSFGHRAVFFRPGGRPIGAIISKERDDCWDESKRAKPYRDLLEPVLWSLRTMAEANDFDAEKAMRASDIAGLKRLRMKIVPPPYSKVRGQGTLVATSNRKNFAARVGECLAVRGRNVAKVALFRYFCEQEAVVGQPQPLESGDDIIERVVYMMLFESGPK